MELDLKALKTVTNRLLDHIIETRGITKVNLEQPYYWDLSPESLYDISQQPKDFDIGSLVDDWEFVSSVLDTHAEPVAYQLTELAPLLRYIGETIGKKLAGEGG